VEKIDAAMGDKQLTDFQRKQFWESALGTLITARGTVVEVTEKGEVVLECPVSSHWKKARVSAKMNSGANLAAIQRNQPLTLRGVLAGHNDGMKLFIGYNRVLELEKASVVK
jgi:hypothetical protein